MPGEHKYGHWRWPGSALRVGSAASLCRWVDGRYVSMELARADPLNGSVYWFTRPTVGWVGWMDQGGCTTATIIYYGG